MNFFKKYWFYIVVGLLIGFGVFVRFQGLGYSSYQGDETNPLRFMVDIKGKRAGLGDFYNFLLQQKRGPGQYLINYLNVSIFGYHGEFFIRLPYAIFSTLALFSLFKLAKSIFDERVAYISLVFMALNGLYIAFARITQYQAFMYFVIPLALYLYLKAYKGHKYLKVSLSAFLLSLALLGHYDTLSVGAFFIAFLLAEVVKKPRQLLYYIKSSLTFLVFFFVPAVLFYIPFLQDSNYAQSTSGYLTGRLFGAGFMPRTPYAELGKLLTLYMPVETWLISFLLVILGLFYIGFGVSKISVYKITLPKKLMYFFYYSSLIVLTFALFFSLFPIKPRTSTILVYLAVLSLSFILIISKKINSSQVGISVWWLFGFAIYFFFIKDPRTHIYVTLMPAFILAAYGVKRTLEVKKYYIKYIFGVLLTSYILYLCSFYWVIFVNKNPEYPWWNKSLYSRNLYEVDRVRHKKVDGVFGFNNYRPWDKVRNLYDQGCLKGTYNSNEKDSITSFYIGFSQTNPEYSDLKINADNLIIVEGPHSWYYWNKEKLDAEVDYTLIKTFYNQDYPVMYIYGLNDVYPQGNFLCVL